MLTLSLPAHAWQRHAEEHCRALRDLQEILEIPNSLPWPIAIPAFMLLYAVCMIPLQAHKLTLKYLRLIHPTISHETPAKTLAVYGELLYHCGAFDEAREYLTRARKKYHHEPQVQAILTRCIALTYLAEGDEESEVKYEKAMKYAEELERKNPVYIIQEE